MTTTIHSADPETLTNGRAADESPAEKISATAEKAKHVVRKTAKDGFETAQDATEEMRENLVKVSAQAREQVEKQPLMAVAGALAVGVVIGMALNRNRY